MLEYFSPEYITKLNELNSYINADRLCCMDYANGKDYICRIIDKNRIERFIENNKEIIKEKYYFYDEYHRLSINILIPKFMTCESKYELIQAYYKMYGFKVLSRERTIVPRIANEFNIKQSDIFIFSYGYSHQINFDTSGHKKSSMPIPIMTFLQNSKTNSKEFFGSIPILDFLQRNGCTKYETNKNMC